MDLYHWCKVVINKLNLQIGKFVQFRHNAYPDGVVVDDGNDIMFLIYRYFIPQKVHLMNLVFFQKNVDAGKGSNYFF